MRSKSNPFLGSTLLCAATLAFCLSAQAGTYYWDTDGSGTPGFGTASGTWGTDGFWGTDPVGSGATANTTITTADDVNFGTASAGLGAGTITGPATAQGFLNMTFGSASGAITISGGTLDLDSTTGSTITVNNASDTLSTVLQGTGGKLIKAGSGILTLSGNNTYTGTTTVNTGTLKISGLLRSTSALVVSGTLDVAATNVFTSGHRVALNAPITIQAGGTVINSNNSVNRIGDVNLNGGTLTATFNEGNYGSYFIGQANGVDPTVTVGGSVASSINATNNGNFKMWSNVNFNVGDVTVDANPDLTVSAVLGNQTADQGGAAASLTKLGSGTMVLTAANNYTGSTTISAGTLKLQNTYASSGFSVASGAVLELNVSSSSRNGATTTFSGAGTLRKTGAGEMVWGSGTATFSLGSGSLIDVQEGTFTGGSFGNESWSANLSDLNVAGGAIFNTVEANVRVNKITGTGTIKTGYPGAGYANLTIGVDNGSSTFDGSIQNSTSTGNLVKTGSGTITLSGNNSHGGTTTITGGTLEFSGTNTIGAVTANGGNVSFTGGTTTINGNLSQTMDGGNAISITNSTLTMNQLYSSANDLGSIGMAFTIGTGADVTATGGTFSRTWRGSGGMFLNGGTLRTSYLAANSTTIPWLNNRGYIHFNGTKIVATANQANFIQLVGGANYGNENFARLESTTEFDTAGFDIGIGVTLNGSGGLIKSGAGTLTLSGANTYTGDTSVDAGTLQLADNAQLKFVVSDSASNTVTGGGTATIDGDFSIDTSAVSGSAGGIWTLVDRLSLTGESFGSTFTVIGYDDSNDDGIWTMSDAKGNWSFDEVTGELTLDIGSDYDDWKTANGVTGGENDDDDSDGLTNHEEYAFGLDPTGGSSVNPILAQLNKSAGTFTYQRRKPSLTGLTTYKILTSTDLVTWIEDVTAGQLATDIPSTDNESVVVTLTTPPTAAKFFVRVSAE